MEKEKDPKTQASGSGTVPDLKDLGITVKEEEGAKKYVWKEQEFNSEVDVMKVVLESYKGAEKKMHEATSETAELKRRIEELETTREKGKESGEEKEIKETEEETGDILFDKEALMKYVTKTVSTIIERERTTQQRVEMTRARSEALQKPEIAENIDMIDKLVTTTAMPLLLANNPRLASALGVNPYIAAYNLLKRTDGSMLSEEEWKKKQKEIEDAKTEGGSKGGKSETEGRSIFDIIKSEGSEIELK